MSVPPPAGNATTMRTGLAGKVCASAPAPAAASRAAIAILFMPGSSGFQGPGRNLELRNTGPRGLILQRIDFSGAVRDAAPRAPLFLARLELPGHQDLVEALGPRASADALDQRVHAQAVFLFRNEQVRPHREEEVSYVLWPVEDLVLIGDVAGKARAREHASEDVHEHRTARALRSSDRQHHALQGFRRVGRGTPFPVERVAQRNFLAALLGDTDLAARGD